MSSASFLLTSINITQHHAGVCVHMCTLTQINQLEYMIFTPIPRSFKKAFLLVCVIVHFQLSY